MPIITKQGVAAQILMLKEQIKECNDPEERRLLESHLKVWERFQVGKIEQHSSCIWSDKSTSKRY